MPEKIKELKSYSSTLLVSDFDEVFFKLSGKKYTEIRETRNKLNKEIEIREDISSIDGFHYFQMNICGAENKTW